MLRKLLKHEFRATGRIMLPLYLVVLLLALGTRFMSIFSVAEAADTLNFVMTSSFNPFNILYGILSVGFVIGLVAVFVVAFVLMILRFRNNLMADEGYVMFTLPVSTHQLIWSKLLTSTVWFLGACVVDMLAFFVLAADGSFLSELWSIIQELFRELNAYYLGNGILFMIELVLLVVISCLGSWLTFYAPMSIGHAFARHKMLLSVVFFFAIQTVVQFMGMMFLTGGASIWGENFLAWMTPEQMTHGIMWVGILINAVYGAILYAVTIRMLHRHLNLE